MKNDFAIKLNSFARCFAGICFLFLLLVTCYGIGYTVKNTASEQVTSLSEGWTDEEGNPVQNTAIVIALDENSIIFSIVSFAWAGFGATFGPLMLFSLFWKRINRAGAIAGMVGGAAMVFIWKLVISTLGGVFAIYELLPAFIFSSICIVVVSLLTAPPSKEIEEDFEAVRTGNVEG